MPERAQVTDVEAIDAFRAKLIVFMTKARASLEDIGTELQRTHSWLEHDRREHWNRETRQRHRVLQEAEQQLFQAKLSSGQIQTAAQVLAVERARRCLREAEEKRESVRKWARQLEAHAGPLARQVDQLLGFITAELPKAAASLGTTVQLLDRYLNMSPDSAGSPPAPTESSQAGSRPQEDHEPGPTGEQPARELS